MKNSVVSKYLLIISLLLFASSCADKNKSESETTKFYSLDGSKLGIEIADKELRIKFNPPIGWDLMHTAISKKTESQGAANSEDSFIYQATYVFFNDSTGGLLSVGKVITSDSSLAKNTRLNFYKGFLTSKHKNEKLSVNNFVHSSIGFTQFKFVKESLISYKIVLENAGGEIIQFDYIIPADYSKSEQPSIKSSIGSIRLM